MKKCSRCKEEKTLDCFYKDKNRKDGKYPYCKDCVKIQQKEREPKIKEYRRKRYAGRREEFLKISKQWRDRNPGKDYQYTKAWNKKNPEKSRAYRNSRKAWVRSGKALNSKFENSMIEALYFISGVLSNSCGETFHVDHIKPIAKGGPHTFDNLQILSAEENFKKGARY